jgi:SAM-dependent methyltransferase
MAWFRRAAPSEPLAITMTGVKLADRLLVLGLRDPALVAALAAKSGLTGRACAIDADASLAARARDAIEREGALVEVAPAPWNALPYEPGSFDLVVVRDVLAAMAHDERGRCLIEVHRVLREGGRVVLIDDLPRGGIGGLLGGRKIDPSYAGRGGVAALSECGFVAARVLAERDGMRFIEGAKRAPGLTPG